MRNILIVLFFSFSCSLWSQTLNVPPRNLVDPNGDEFVAIIQNMSLTNREDAIYNAVLGGNIPDFMRTLKPITDSLWNGTNYDHIVYFVIPDYLAIGSDANYYLCPMTPILAQKLCDTLNCILPTRKMSNRIWATAPLHMNPQTIPPSPLMITVPVMADHDSMVWNQRQSNLVSYPLGTLTAGDKKDVILSNYIYAYPPPDRVVIFGWHYTSGTPIQPMYAGHESTYADYSHGIRLVQNLVWVNGVPTTATAVLTSPILYALLSDEGTIDPPRYPIGTTVSVPPKPTSFCVKNESNTELRIKIKPDNSVLFYKIYTSIDGVNFSTPITAITNNIILSGLTTNLIYYIKFTATNAAGESPMSEVLASVPSNDPSRLLIINAYDRPKATNTYDFIRYHAPSILNDGVIFNASTNEALADGLDTMAVYEMVDYILGEESTANETFSTAEQVRVANYLDNGGKLLVSGAEIGWDLHHLGNATDSLFYKDYLKAKYVFDAPNDQSGTYYTFEPITGGIFDSIPSMNFDDGSAGIYDVVYPDAIEAVNGGSNAMLYTTISNFAAVNYHGLFPNGSMPGKLVYMGFPFETITTTINRDTVMKRILDYFMFVPSTASAPLMDQMEFAIYPNPSSGFFHISIKNNTNSNYRIYNNMGIEVMQGSILGDLSMLDLTSLSNGIYLLSISVDQTNFTKKIIKE